MSETCETLHSNTDEFNDEQTSGPYQLRAPLLRPRFKAWQTLCATFKGLQQVLHMMEEDRSVLEADDNACTHAGLGVILTNQQPVASSQSVDAHTPRHSDSPYLCKIFLENSTKILDSNGLKFQLIDCSSYRERSATTECIITQFPSLLFPLNHQTSNHELRPYWACVQMTTRAVHFTALAFWYFKSSPLCNLALCVRVCSVWLTSFCLCISVFLSLTFCSLCKPQIDSWSRQSWSFPFLRLH